MRPERFTEAEWSALTPRQKVLYSTNSGLWKPGEKTKDRGVREKAPKVNSRGLVKIDDIPGPMQVDTGPGVLVGGGGGQGSSLTTLPPAFEVHRSDDPMEVARVNGARLMVDAMTRAARAQQNIDPFDKHVYLAMVQKLTLPMAGPEGPETPAESKENVRRLKALLASGGGGVAEGEFREVQGG